MKCPSCGFNNRKSATVCKGCNDELPEFSPRITSSSSHCMAGARCRFHDGDSYCPAPATGRTNGGDWYCDYHNEAQDFKEGRSILEDLLTHGIPRNKHYADFIVDLVVSGVSPEAAIGKWRERV